MPAQKYKSNVRYRRVKGGQEEQTTKLIIMGNTMLRKFFCSQKSKLELFRNLCSSLPPLGMVPAQCCLLGLT